MARIIHGANRGRLRQTIDLKNRNAQHHEEALRLDCERRRTADQGFQVSPDGLADFRKHQRAREKKASAVHKKHLSIRKRKKGALRTVKMVAVIPPRF